MVHKDNASNTTRDHMLGPNDYEICFFSNTPAGKEKTNSDPKQVMKGKYTKIRRNKLLHDQDWVFDRGKDQCLLTFFIRLSMDTLFASLEIAGISLCPHGEYASDGALIFSVSICALSLIFSPYS